MYNEKVKNEYLNLHKEGTQKTISRVFKISRQSEEDLGKDLHDFSREQIRKLLFLFHAKTEYSSRSNSSLIQSYIDYCIEAGYRKGLNPLEGTDKAWKEQFVNKSIKKYWTKKEMYRVIDKLRNSQDQAICILPFFGIRGKENAEMLNLKIEDVDAEKNILYVRDDKEKLKRKVHVDQRCIEICLKASKEFEYEKKNGKPDPNTKSLVTNLVSNRYVVKSSITRGDRQEDADSHIVHRRLSNISEMIGEPSFASPLNLVYSGMIYAAYTLMQASGKLEDEEFKLICEQFDVDLDQSLQRLKSEFLNIEFIKSMYENES